MSAIKLYPYQKRWLLDRSRFKISMQARQTGKSFTTTLEIVDRCFEAEVNKTKQRWVMLSRGERQAKELIDEGIKAHCKAYSLGFESLEYEWKSSEATYKALEVVLPNGSRITALPANPDTARGFSANVYLDEFAFHQDSRKIWSALFPVISNGYDIRITSTPNGKGNRFFDLMTANDQLWSRHVTDIYTAVAEGLPRDIEELKRALNDDDGWAQEYELQWLDEASAWLSYDLINGCEHEAAGIPENYQGGKCFIGNDIGRRNDLWVAWIWEVVGDCLWCREVRTLKRASFAEQAANLDELIETYNPVRVCMDQTGLGEGQVEATQLRHGKYRIEGVLFTSSSKQHLANSIKQAFEDRKTRIPLGDVPLRTDLHKVRKITTPLGNIRFDADSDSNGHADRFWAAALGIYAAGSQKRVIMPDFGVENNLLAY